MFSRTERAFLEILRRSPGAGASVELEAAFPNPAYRRKLMWGIRQKAGRSLADWQLYSVAARRDPRLLPPELSTPGARVPLFADPLVTFGQRLRRAWFRRRPSASLPRAADPPRGS